MSYNEEAWRRYVLAYDIEVAQEDVEEELYLIRADMKHRMVYAQMMGEESHGMILSAVNFNGDLSVTTTIDEVKGGSQVG
jgi:tRNA-binding EMAP/Myf-like protein